MKLVVINKLSDQWISDLQSSVPGAIVESYPSPKEALPHISDADAIAMWGFQDVEPVLNAAPNVRWIHSLSDGVERLLSPSMMKRSIALTNSHGIHDRTVAEHTMALLLGFSRQIPQAVRQQDSKTWKRPKSFSIYKKTIAIIGFGGIGRAIAQRAKSFETKIIAVKKHASEELFADKICTTEKVNEVLPAADIIIAALPATKDTEHFFNKERFSFMKDGAIFINIARASIVDEEALINALAEKKLAGAALDVFSKEPLPENHPLWSMKNVIITPHVASFTPDSWDRILYLLKDNFISFSQGLPLVNEIDKQKGY